MNETLYVTRPYLPPLEEFVAELEKIWTSRILTNAGPYHQRLEATLAQMLGVPHISLFTNGTIALMTALETMRLSGEIITTPYSFVATSHAIVKSGCRPVFVDIDPFTLNLDPARIEAAITPASSAVLPVHCYGRPCDVDAIREIAERRKLVVVYDAAHAFGVDYQGRSVLERGDLSVLSFHATKVFNTFEGGAIVCHDAEVKRRIDRLRNFGFEDEVTVSEIGGNGKMSEMNAALGLLQLKYLSHAVELRKRIDGIYRRRLSGITGVRCLGGGHDPQGNHAYFPVLIQDDFPVTRDALYTRFRESDIHARRYFFPLISSFPMYRHLPSADPKHLPVAEDAARRVLCLPIFPDMTDVQIERVLRVIEDV
ncbi:MAG: DegT/DnrJ/EryC1/StrS family aminotransferase [Steroidobacteraceae bacterium]